ncbi:MAG: N-acetyl-gamma-glutamyl-phosphate reductase [Candidatus Omnitrophica bacterium]|nr:N-acetyl-gamma-glutamyl-phosphate reductase [Candidatus Omnitrophota bacterium]MDD5771440.1 N-acetyl-gamma-glutamyl-phosphate reductase [Candidatus Omnitrophota bacterium]
MMVINVGIIGATGHTGEVLIELLLNHPNVRISGLFNSGRGGGGPQIISDVFPKFKNRLDISCTKPDWAKIKKDCDLVFLALPHTVSMNFVPRLLSLGKKVIDLSADYRFANPSVYEKYYKVTHKDKANLKQAVYGLPELYRAKIKTARLLANPGCYPTSAILALAPLLAVELADKDSIVIDAKSGVSGAGKKVEKEFLFSEIQGDFRAYKVNAHQHAPEINQVLSKFSGKKLDVVFVPHLLPIERGILSTVYLKKKPGARLMAKNITELFRKFYKKEPFVRIKADGSFPRIRDVAKTNFCDIGVKDFGRTIIVISAIDNLLKGASAQAVQNMNIMYGLPEKTGLL